MIAFSDVVDAYNRLQPVVHKTPVVSSQKLNVLTRNTLFFKCENFQRGGAFKIRGAYNKISRLSEAALKKGIVAFSSGNHAQGVALAARLLNTHAKIVMPNNAPTTKVEATRSYGAEVISYDYLTQDREEIGRKIAQHEGRTVVPPFNDDLIIAGQGTVALEIFDLLASLDYFFFPVGGGGLISGNAVVIKHLFPRVKVIGVETEAANDAYQSFRQKKIVKIAPPNTIADGMRTLSLGDKTFAIIEKFVDDIVTVSDAEVVKAMELIYSRLKIVVEPTAAVPFAAVLKNELGIDHQRVGVLLSGGNVDLENFFKHFRGQNAD
jgi:threonine dehydratase